MPRRGEQYTFAGLARLAVGIWQFGSNEDRCEQQRNEFAKHWHCKPRDGVSRMFRYVSGISYL
jgi:hypothetical protein